MSLRVTFVCTGNICRSPAAHAVFAAALAERRHLPWTRDIVVESAGLGGWHAGELPDPRARAEGARRGYVLDHPARQVGRVDFDGLLIAMDQSHARGLGPKAPAGFDVERLVLFRSFDPEAAGDRDVADPYYDDDAAFVAMFDVIGRTMPGLLAWVEGHATR